MDDVEFGRALEANRKRGLALAFRLAGSEAQDLLQDACVRAWSGRGSYDARQPFWPWFLRVLVNTRADKLRHVAGRRKRTGTILSLTQMLGDGYDVEDAAQCPFAAAAAVDLNTRLSAAVQDLPQSQRAAFLRSLAGEEPKDIAEDLHINPNSIRGMIWHARQKLKKVLCQHE